MSFALIDRLSLIRPSRARRWRMLVLLLAMLTPVALALPWTRFLPGWERLPLLALPGILIVLSGCMGARSTGAFLLLPLCTMAAAMLLIHNIAPSLIAAPGLEMPPPILPILLVVLPPLLLALAAQAGLFLSALATLLAAPLAFACWHVAAALVLGNPLLHGLLGTGCAALLAALALTAAYGVAVSGGLFNGFESDSSGETVIADA